MDVRLSTKHGVMHAFFHIIPVATKKTLKFVAYTEGVGYTIQIGSLVGTGSVTQIHVLRSNGFNYMQYSLGRRYGLLLMSLDRGKRRSYFRTESAFGVEHSV